jgi:hypothetical protein
MSYCHTHKFWFFKDITMGLYLNDAYNAVMLTRNGEVYMKTKTPDKPFLVINDPFIIEFRNRLKYKDKHDATSFTVLMRLTEHIFKSGLDNFKIAYIKENRRDMCRAVRIIENKWLDILMSPFTDVGKRRLEKEFEEFSKEMEEIYLKNKCE